MNKLVEIAKGYIGQKEKPGNSGFLDPVFEKKMIKVGFQKGFAWCALATKLCAIEAYPEKAAEFMKLFSPSAVTTFYNLQKAGYKVSNSPSVGAIVVWQRYNAGKKSWQGHVGIVSEVPDRLTFKAIEGNTNAAGSREGEVMAEKLRKLGFVQTGLNVLGFITLN
jgi:hypothetical protein